MSGAPHRRGASPPAPPRPRGGRPPVAPPPLPPRARRTESAMPRGKLVVRSSRAAIDGPWFDPRELLIDDDVEVAPATVRWSVDEARATSPPHAGRDVPPPLVGSNSRPLRAVSAVAPPHLPGPEVHDDEPPTAEFAFPEDLFASMPALPPPDPASSEDAWAPPLVPRLTGVPESPWLTASMAPRGPTAASPPPLPENADPPEGGDHPVPPPVTDERTGETPYVRATATEPAFRSRRWPLPVALGALVVLGGSGWWVVSMVELSPAAGADDGAPAAAEAPVAVPVSEAPLGSAPALEDAEVATIESAPSSPPAPACGPLRVTSPAPGHHVWVDGRDRGPSPVTVDVSCGVHTVVLVRGGRVLDRTVRRVDIGPGSSTFAYPWSALSARSR
ncbi:MAG: PEGA domain-containing protein [Myxococcota bacterium]